MKIDIIPSVLAILALSHVARAVSPAPDGGYPGGNTAEGQNALLSLTGGAYNTAVGFLSLKSDTKGQFNTAIGAGALLANTGDQSTGAGVENTATGAGALLSNTTGCCNTANGAFALFSNINAAENAAFGANALFSNVEANDNSAFGYQALRSNTGGGNTAIGAYSLISNTTGTINTAVGLSALAPNTTGSHNIAVGYASGGGVTTADHVICIGEIAGSDVSNSCYIANIWNQLGGSQAVYVNSEGKLGAQVSSQRFKDDINPMGQASEVIYGLKPVSFRYKPEIEPTRPRAFGLIAEDVEKVSPDLVTRGARGKVNSVRYDQVNAMLLNEFLKAHRKIEGQQKQIDTLTTQLKEQADQLQKVSVQVGLNRPVHPVVLNNP
jgi:Chaperone of endosialidase